MRDKHSLIIRAIMRIIRVEFSLLEDRPKSNMEVIPMFLDTILLVDNDKATIYDLCLSLFKSFLLLELDTILENIDENLCIQKCNKHEIINHPVRVFLIFIIESCPWVVKCFPLIKENWLFLLSITHV